MRSRTDLSAELSGQRASGLPRTRRARLVLEWIARTVAFGALLAAIWWSVFGAPLVRMTDANSAIAVGPADSWTNTRTDSLVELLLSRLGHPDQPHVTLAVHTVPDTRVRGLLHAAQLAGVNVQWREASGTLLPVALSSSPVPDPNGGMIVRAAAPNGAAFTLADSLGWLDSAFVETEGVQWSIAGLPRALTAGDVRAHEPPTLRLGRLRLFSAPGWEARFVMRVLEESGWDVDAEFSIAPRVRVSAGTPAALDTSRYSAVIALDSTAWNSAAAIARFVQSGGGLVLFGSAARSSAFAAVRISAAGAAQPGIPGALQTSTPREGLALRSIAAGGSDVTVLERSTRPGAPVALAAHRVGAGRVLQVGWEQTWEWRMLGVDGAEQAHRDWWRSLVQRVAFGAEEATAEWWEPLPGAAAPLADWVARLGPPSVEETAPGTDTSAMAQPAPPPPWLFAIGVLALLTEWWSRRLRGAR